MVEVQVIQRNIQGQQEDQEDVSQADVVRTPLTPVTGNRSDSC